MSSAGGAQNVSGNSKIELDTQLLNSLLAMFVNKPGMQVQVDQTGLRVQQGPLSVGLEPFNIQQGLRFQLRNGNLGPFAVQVSQIQLGAQGLTVSLQLQT
jgi:hypothetical protein